MSLPGDNLHLTACQHTTQGVEETFYSYRETLTSHFCAKQVKVFILEQHTFDSWLHLIGNVCGTRLLLNNMCIKNKCVRLY